MFKKLVLRSLFYEIEEKKHFSITTTHILNSHRRADKKVFKYSLISLFALYYCG